MVEGRFLLEKLVRQLGEADHIQEEAQVTGALGSHRPARCWSRGPGKVPKCSRKGWAWPPRLSCCI